MSRKKAGHVFLETINKPATSLSPDDMRVPEKTPRQWVAEKGLQALTSSMQGTGQRAPMPRRRRQLFTQDYYKGSLRSEEHTSELQSRRDLVCRLLLEKKKNRTT